MATATPSWGVINPGKHPDTLTGRRGLFIGARDRERMANNKEGAPHSLLRVTCNATITEAAKTWDEHFGAFVRESFSEVLAKTLNTGQTPEDLEEDLFDFETWPDDEKLLYEVQALVTCGAYALRAMDLEDSESFELAFHYMGRSQYWLGGTVATLAGTVATLAILKSGALSNEKARRAALSNAGRLGARSKNQGTDALKAWALEKSRSMRGADIEIARQLSARLPEHLADVSKDPARLIYDALRADREKNAHTPG